MSGCSGCPGGGGGTYNVAPPPIRNAAPNVPSQVEEGYVLLRYIGKSKTTISYTGTKSAKKYRFGNNPGHQQKYIFEDDLDGLLALSDAGNPLFQVMNPVGPRVNGGAPQIQATAPKREPIAEPVEVAATSRPDRQDGEQLQRLAEGGPESQGHLAQPTGPDVDDMTLKQIEDVLDSLSLENIATMMAKEKGGQNRKTVVARLRRAMLAKT